jgi:hypothetical protein
MHPDNGHPHPSESGCTAIRGWDHGWMLMSSKLVPRLSVLTATKKNGLYVVNMAQPHILEVNAVQSKRKPVP